MIISTLVFTAFLASAQLVSLDTKETDLSEFLRLMANMANRNVVIHPAVQGKVNLMVKNAPWDQVLDLVMKDHGLKMEVQGNTMRIVPTAIFEAEQKQKAAEEALLPLRTRVFFLKYAKAEDIAVIISRMLSPRGSVIVYGPRNAVIITDVVRDPESPR